MGRDSVAEIAKTWFRYKTNKVKNIFKDFKVNSLGFFPILTGIMNLVFLGSFLGFILLKGAKYSPLLRNSLLLGAGLWVINFFFSVFASPIAMRFQVFPALVFLTLALLLVDWIYKMSRVEQIA